MKGRCKGFSILETSIAALIFSIASLGNLSTIAALKQPAHVTEQKVYAAYYGQQILEDLRAKVDQRNWNDPSSLLAISPPAHTSSTVINNVTYTATYTVTEDASISDPAKRPRKVDLTISW